jgi:deoxyribonuclease-4
VCCLEDTVGSGSNLGRTFDELADLRARILDQGCDPTRVGYCFDTCHAHAGGYDLSERQAAESVLNEFDRLCGLSNLRVVHVNDSMKEAGSRRDRHAHIGEGTIGRSTRISALRESGFAAVVNRPELRRVPKIMETPKGATKAGTAFDTLNLRRLKKLMD